MFGFIQLGIIVHGSPHDVNRCKVAVCFIQWKDNSIYISPKGRVHPLWVDGANRSMYNFGTLMKLPHSHVSSHSCKSHQFFVIHFNYFIPIDSTCASHIYS